MRIASATGPLTQSSGKVSPTDLDATASAASDGSASAPTDFEALLALSLTPSQEKRLPCSDYDESLSLSAQTPTADDSGVHYEDAAQSAVQDLLAQLPVNLPVNPPVNLSANLPAPPETGIHVSGDDSLTSIEPDSGKLTPEMSAHIRHAQPSQWATEFSLPATPHAADTENVSGARMEDASSEQLTTKSLPELGMQGPASFPVPKSTHEQRTVHAPLGSERWNHAFSQQISWLAKSAVQSASLMLNPPELGPVRVELQLSGNETSAHFSSPVPEVRQAIEAALPELKSLMASTGLSLADASVNQGGYEHRQQQGSNDQPNQTTNSASVFAADTTTVTTPANVRTLSKRLVDLYA